MLTGKFWKDSNVERYVKVGEERCIPTQWSTMCLLLKSGTVKISFDGIDMTESFRLYAKFIVSVIPGSVPVKELFDDYKIAVKLTNCPKFESEDF